MEMSVEQVEVLEPMYGSSSLCKLNANTTRLGEGALYSD